MKAPSKSKDTAKEVRLDEAAQAALDESIRRQKLAFDRKVGRCAFKRQTRTDPYGCL